MAFKRARLQEIIEDESLSPAEKAEQIMTEHLSVVNPLKEERDSLKEKADQVPDLQKQVEKLTGEAEDFAKERKSFEDYRSQVEQNENLAKVKSAFDRMLKEENYSDKWRERILESTNLSELKLGEDGKLVDEKNHRNAVNEKWSDVKTTVTEKGAVVEKPLQTGKAMKSKDEIMAIQDTKERQKAIAENHEMFGF